MTFLQRLALAVLRQPHPHTDLRQVYYQGAVPEDLLRLEAARDAPLNAYPPPSWTGVWSRPFGDRLVRVIR